MNKIISIDCPLCLSKEYKTYSSGEFWEYAVCKECGLLYLRKRQKNEDLYESYSGGFFKDVRRKLTYPFRKVGSFKNLNKSLSRCENIIDKIEQWVYPPGKILDVGCNKGYLLATALCRGWDVYGIELIPELPMVIKREFQLEDKIFSGDIKKNQDYFSDDFFDCISLIDMIEHFDDPISDLRHLNRIIRKGGILFIQTPDFDNVLSKMQKTSWGGLNPREHLCIYNNKSLKTLLTKTGFRFLRQQGGIDKCCGNMIAAAIKE